MTGVRAWRCSTHRGLLTGPCWHGACRLCGRGITAFDFCEQDAIDIVLAHIAKEHPCAAIT